MTDLGNITQHTLVSTSATCWYRWSVLALAVRQKGAVLRPEWYSDTRHWCQLVWMWILILFDLNFSKSACAFNVTSMFYISLERYIVRAVSVAFKPFRKREQPWNVRFFLAFLRIFCTILKHSIFSYIGFFYDLKTKRRSKNIPKHSRERWNDNFCLFPPSALEPSPVFALLLISGVVVVHQVHEISMFY